MKVVSLGAAAALLIFCLLASSATATNNVDFRSRAGTLSGTTVGLSFFRSPLVGVGFNVIDGNHDFSSFSRASLVSNLGFPNDILFSGTFSGPVTCTLIKIANGSHNYTVTGVVVGSMVGQLVNAVSIRLTINMGTELFQNSTLMAGADNRTVSSVPEPSTLALLLTGSVGTLGMMWRKLLTK
jgi:hypothetical protein